MATRLKHLLLPSTFSFRRYVSLQFPPYLGFFSVGYTATSLGCFAYTILGGFGISVHYGNKEYITKEEVKAFKEELPLLVREEVHAIMSGSGQRTREGKGKGKGQ